MEDLKTALNTAQAAAAAREEAAKLRGQAEALQAQHVELMQVLKQREGERPAPQGGKNNAYLLLQYRFVMHNIYITQHGVDHAPAESPVQGGEC